MISGLVGPPRQHGRRPRPVGIGVRFAGGQRWVTVRFAKGSLPAPPPSQAEVSVAGRYVDAVHRLFLARAASRGDLDRWGAVVARGDRGRLTSALAVSNEWAGSRVAGTVAASEEFWQRSTR